jgi:hypothetical protein
VSREALRNSAFEESDREFLIIEGCGVLVSGNISPAGQAMLSGLAEVVQRIGASVPIRYLQAAEIAALSPETMHRYCELANGSCLPGWNR